jgi:single-strand DNA-binding protein
MANLNLVQLIGNMTKDIELRYSQSGMAVGNFSIATNKEWTDKATGSKQKKTEFHNLTVFGKQAETMEKYTSKGSSIYVSGELQTSTYEKDGQTHYSTKIIVNQFQFLDSKKSEPDQDRRPERQQRPTEQARQQAAAYDESDIPF